MKYNPLIAITSADNINYTIRAIESINSSRYDIVVFDDASVDLIENYCINKNIPFFGEKEPKGLTNLWNKAFNYFLEHKDYTHLILSNNDVVFSNDAIYNLGKSAITHNVDMIGPMSNKPGPIKEQIPTDYEVQLNMNDPDLVDITQNILNKLPVIHSFDWFKKSNKVNGFCFMLSRNIKQIMNTVDCLIPPHLINTGNDDWICQEVVNNNLKIGICRAAFVYHHKALTTRLCKDGNRNNLYRDIPFFGSFIKKNNKIKPTILCTADKAMGLGDGIMLSSVLIELSKEFKVKIMASYSSYNSIKLLKNYNDIHVYNVNMQNDFYENDFYKSYNLIYWDTYNSLRQLPNHAINMMMKSADLPIYTYSSNKQLPDLPLDKNIENKIELFLKSFNKKIIVATPIVSYFNKMFDYNKLHDVINILKDEYIIIQLGGGNISSHMHHKESINFIDNTSIEQSISIIKYADCVISGDSFVSHVAAHTKTPAVTLFCGTSPEDFGYVYNSNIFHPEIVPCQFKCGRPMRWLYDYEYKNKSEWNSRNEMGWICPVKFCEKAITVDEILCETEKQIKIGKDRDWRFYDYKL